MTDEEIKAYKGNPAGTIFGLMEHIRPKKCKMVNGGNRMTNKEAIMLLNPSTRILALAEIECYNGFRGKEAYIKAKEDACILAVEALEKADKYKWHDLRKNPDDLPEAIGGGYESEYVLVMIGTPEWNHCEFVYYDHNRKVWPSLYEQNIFAWRYIEPFKEEK